MKITFIATKSHELENIAEEIASAGKVRSYELTTILPPDDIVSAYLLHHDRIVLGQYLDAKFSQSEYDRLVLFLEQKWQPVEAKFFKQLAAITDIEPLPHYAASITKYGPGGSYRFPDEVTIRMATDDDLEYCEVNLAHELIHLLVEPFVQKQKLTHNEKEELISTILFQPEIDGIFGIKNEKVFTSVMFQDFKKYLTLENN